MKRFRFLAGIFFLAQIFISLPLAGQCPSQVLFQTQDPCGVNAPGFYFYFPSPAGIPITFEVRFAGACFTGTSTATKYFSCNKTWWSASSFACGQNPTGWFTFTFPNGTSSQCYFNNGQPASCGKFLVPCTDELRTLAKDFITVSGSDCKQWEGPCNTDSEIFRSGPVAIGTNSRFSDLTGYKLVVKGGITSEMLKLCNGEWCDYVFSDTFRLKPLSEVRQYIEANRHLPGSTPGTVIENEGAFSLGDEAVQQQEKIEEVFLHLIELRKRLDALSVHSAHLGLTSAAHIGESPSSLPQPADSKVGISLNTVTPDLSLQCFQIAPATGDNTTDGQAGIKVSNVTNSPLTVSWTIGTVTNVKTNVICTDGVIKLAGLKKGTYTVTVTQANGTSATCMFTIYKGMQVSCDELSQEPCRTEIFNAVKAGIANTPPTCKQWEGDPCSISDHIYRLGNVGIGSSVIPSGYSLAVKGSILTDHFFIELCESHGWCDYVFDPEYSLPDLYKVEQHIRTYQRLPGSVSQAEVMAEGGIEMGSVKLDQQKKIEESFLYLIGMNKKLETLKTQIESFE